MKIKQTIRNMVLAGLLLIPVFALVAPAPSTQAACGGVETAIINCDQDNTDKDGDNSVSASETGLWGLLIMTINILTAGVGVLALGGIIYGAILYTSAGGSPEQVKKARTIFTNVAIGVIAFAGMFTLLNFIVPGGVFN